MLSKTTLTKTTCRSNLIMSEIVKCRYKNCAHGGEINKNTDDYVANGRMYYHRDCYELKKIDDAKAKQTNEDLAEFRELWRTRISDTVLWGALNKMIGEYLKRGISSDQMLFTLKYVIKHHYRINHPAGFRYYMDRSEIKKAYDTYKKSKAQASTIAVTDEEKPVKFKVPKRKTLEDIENTFK